MSFWQMFYSVGSFIAFWINYACTKHTNTLGEWDWKMVIIFQLLMPVLIIAQVFFIPETPRWYIQHGGKVEKARASLRRVRATEQEVEDEILTIREALEFEKEAVSSTYTALWKDRSVRKRLLLAFVINAGQQITGQGSLNTYSTKVYQKVFTDASTIQLINALNATFSILFTMNATWTVDRFGRKFLLIVGAIGMGICMIIVAAVDTETPSGPKGQKTEPVGISIVFLLFLFAFFCKYSHNAFVWPYILIRIRQAILGSNRLDLDLRSLFHERPRPGRWYGVSDPEHCQRHRPAVLPYLPPELRLLRLLHVCRYQPPPRHLRLVLHS